jgi:hypothetical protein
VTEVTARGSLHPGPSLRDKIEKVLRHHFGGGYTITGRRPAVDELEALLDELILDSFEDGEKAGREYQQRLNREYHL